MAFNLGAFGLTLPQMQAAQEIGKQLRIKVIKFPKEGRLEIKYIALNPRDRTASELAANAVDTMAAQLAYLHDTMFGMKGEIIHVE